MNIDWKKVVEELGSVLSDRLSGLVDAAEDDAEGDLQAYGKDIAKGIIVALRSGRKDLRDELKDQAIMLGEIHRIKLSNEALDMLDLAGDIALKVGVAAIGAL